MRKPERAQKHHQASYRARAAQGGQPVTCPLRCTPPERVVANAPVRALVASGARDADGSGEDDEDGEDEDEDEEEDALQMAPMCNLGDDMLPLDAASIKQRQVAARPLPATWERGSKLLLLRARPWGRLFLCSCRFCAGGRGCLQPCPKPLS